MAHASQPRRPPNVWLRAEVNNSRGDAQHIVSLSKEQLTELNTAIRSAWVELRQAPPTEVKVVAVIKAVAGDVTVARGRGGVAIRFGSGSAGVYIDTPGSYDAVTRLIDQARSRSR